MPMNRVDRLFAILLKMSGGTIVKAADLARSFELSERTIYRDMDALSQVGIPIRGEPGVGYELMPGYFVPPLLFTADEAVALSLGIGMLRDRTTGRLTESAGRSLKKLRAVLPASTRRDVDQWTSIISFTKPERVFDIEDTHLAELFRAIREHRVLTIRYRSYLQPETGIRSIEPTGLFYAPGTGVWYVEAFCRKRQDIRSFRVDRIASVTVEPECFTRHFESGTPAPNGDSKGRADNGASADLGAYVEMLVKADDAQWVRERQHWTFFEEYDLDAGDSTSPDALVSMRYGVRDPQGLLQWMLSCAPWIQGIEPDSFRQLFADELRRLQRLLT